MLPNYGEYTQLRDIGDLSKDVPLEYTRHRYFMATRQVENTEGVAVDVPMVTDDKTALLESMIVPHLLFSMKKEMTNFHQRQRQNFKQSKVLKLH